MKNFLKFFVLVSLLILFSTGCGNASGDSTNDPSSGKDQVTLTFFSTITMEPQKEVMASVVDQFEEENPEIVIDDNYPGGEYESMLRVKMAANDMPDLFDTHGWAKKRYGEYVVDLSNMDWVDRLDPALDQIFKDKDGKVYAYPLNQAKDGLIYNKTLLNNYGIEPPGTFEEFMAALEEIKEKSDGEVIPLWFAGSDKSALAQYFDQFATPLLITHQDHNYEEELLNGNFDWSNYTFLAEKLLEMQQKGLINKDVLTAQNHEMVSLMAQEKIGFVMGGLTGHDVEEMNPNVQLGIIPVPSIHEGGIPSWIGGERHTVAIWKDTDHPEEARKFIEFLSQPDIVKKIADGTSLPPGLTGVESDNYFATDYEAYSHVKVEPYFDRVYLPSGMWDVMGTTAQELLSGSLTPEEVSNTMDEEYNRLKEQK